MLLESSIDLFWTNTTVIVGISGLESVFDILHGISIELVSGEFGNSSDGILGFLERPFSIIVLIDHLEEVDSHLLWGDGTRVISIGFLELSLNEFLPIFWKSVTEVVHGSLEGSLGLLKIP